MQTSFEPIQAESLKDVFISRFEKLIFTGELAIGQKLPSERDLAQQLGVSRPVVHEGLVELSAKGLITMKPRNGAVVNAFRKEGSPAMLRSLLNYTNGELAPTLLNSVLDMRRLMEVEFTGLAAKNRTPAQLDELKQILAKEKKTDHRDSAKTAQLDFQFHHTIAMASENMVYPLILNSFRAFYTHLVQRFYSDRDVMAFVYGMHTRLVDAIEQKDASAARALMEEMIDHGATHLKSMLP